MALITANRFNTLRQSVDNVLGNGAGDTGYGQTLTSAAINVGDIINARKNSKTPHRLKF